MLFRNTNISFAPPTLESMIQCHRNRRKTERESFLCKIWLQILPWIYNNCQLIHVLESFIGSDFATSMTLVPLRWHIQFELQWDLPLWSDWAYCWWSEEHLLQFESQIHMYTYCSYLKNHQHQDIYTKWTVVRVVFNISLRNNLNNSGNLAMIS